MLANVGFIFDATKRKGHSSNPTSIAANKATTTNDPSNPMLAPRFGNRPMAERPLMPGAAFVPPLTTHGGVNQIPRMQVGGVSAHPDMENRKTGHVPYQNHRILNHGYGFDQGNGPTEKNAQQIPFDSEMNMKSI